MLQFPEIDPVAVSLGPLQIHWYAVTYIVGFLAAWYLGVRRARAPESGWKSTEITDLVTNSAIGVIVGGRLGYMLFYNFGGFVSDPLSLFRLWDGGMSFHGGMLGVAAALWLFARTTGRSVFRVMDFAAPLTPLGLAAGRAGNFINGELWGRPADLPWAMVFPADSLQLARHPSQLYQFALEGLCLFVILWLYSSRPRPAFAVTGAFVLGYGIFRTFVEFFREPDSHLMDSLWFGWMTRGQQLSIPMIILGLGILFMAYRFDSFARIQTRNKGAE